jgi:uncharacterized membrane protein
MNAGIFFRGLVLIGRLPEVFGDKGILIQMKYVKKLLRKPYFVIA